ncbi:MAG: signal recognition particle protein Srp19, partial [Candidatus Korarchaeota archaeon]|nr:signal recognition particle protein Srp19 [Candidatus Korarchaeota archaeon]
MHRKDKIVVWPAYFDSTKTRSEGRRIAKVMAVPSPEIKELRGAAKKLDLDYEEFSDACYPKTPWLDTGMLLVLKREHKSQTIKKIAKS